MGGAERDLVVVTGGAGFIGANLVATLLATGTARRVVVVDDLSSGSLENLDLDVDTAALEVVVHDVRAIGELRTLLAGADAIVHLAAQVSVPASMADPVETTDVNTAGTLAVLEAARTAGGIPTVLASSAAVYGAQQVPRHHEGLPPRPASPYAASKLAAETLAATYTRAYGQPTLSLRFFNVYGPLQPVDHAYAAAIPAFVSAGVAGRPITLHGDGEQTRDFVHVATVTEVLRRAVAERVALTAPVNLASGTSVTLNQVLAVLAGVLGEELLVRCGPPRPGDLRTSCAATSRLHQVFPGLVVTDLETGLRDTVAWFRRGTGTGTHRRSAGSESSRAGRTGATHGQRQVGNGRSPAAPAASAG